MVLEAVTATVAVEGSVIQDHLACEVHCCTLPPFTACLCGLYRGV